jgi:hypothetical protein
VTRGFVAVRCRGWQRHSAWWHAVGVVECCWNTWIRLKLSSRMLSHCLCAWYAGQMFRSRCTASWQRAAATVHCRLLRHRALLLLLLLQLQLTPAGTAVLGCPPSLRAAAGIPHISFVYPVPSVLASLQAGSRQHGKPPGGDLA